MKKKHFNEMVATKQKLEAKIKALSEAKRRSSLSYLIESELEKAEIVIATKAIVDKIGKMAEDMLSVEGDDIMPMMDSLKAAYGPQMAETFQQAVTQRIRAAVENLTQTKDAVSTEVGKLEGVFNGDAPPSDMGTTDLPDVDPAADVAADPLAGGDDLGADLPADETADDSAFAANDLSDLGSDPLGRARKESAARKGKPLTEGLLASIREVLATHFDDVTADRSPREQLEALKPFVNAADYEIASQFPDQLLKMVFDRVEAPVAADPVVDVVPSVPAPVVHHDVVPSEPVVHVDPVDSVGADLGSDLDDVEMDPVMDEPYDMAFESANAKRLRESKNPDAMIFNVFKRVVKEGVAVKVAITKVAEAFSIEKEDVVTIVREAKEAEDKAKKDADEAAKPGKDWNKLYAAIKDDGMTIAAMTAHIADNTKDKADKAAIKAWLMVKTKIKESEGDVGFKAVAKTKYPKPSVTALATKSTKKGSTVKSPVIGAVKKK